MQDAFNLGWKLAIAAHDEAALGLLDSYHAERHPVAARVIEETTRLTAISTLSRPYERVLRDHLIHLGGLSQAPATNETALFTKVPREPV